MPRRKVNQAEFAKLYESGTPMKAIMAHFGVLSKTTLQDNRKQLGLKARPHGAPKKRKQVSHGN